MQTGDVANRKAKNSRHSHRSPKAEAEDVWIIENYGRLTKDDHERTKQYDGIDVVVERQKPDTVIHFRQNSLDVNGVKWNKKWGKNTIDCSRNRQGPWNSIE